MYVYGNDMVLIILARKNRARTFAQDISRALSTDSILSYRPRLTSWFASVTRHK